jgi:serine/threonine protein kinase
VRAAREEFISPVVPGISRFPGTADRVFVEGERHYLVMQLGKARSKQSRKVIMLSELLCQPRWPWWLDIAAALSWSIQLGRTVARLHRLGGIVGDLNLDTILVDTSRAARSPVLLVSWPPPPRYWPDSPAGPATYEQYTRVFPIADVPTSTPFAAPEVIDGVYDVRSDVYSLGALLYLLCTHFAPSAAVRRQRTASISASLPLIPPRLLNSRLSAALEGILFRALAFDPAERYPSAFALVEALEALP